MPTAAFSAMAPAAASIERSCTSSPHPLTFWLGRWDVYSDGKLDGHNFIESSLGDCVVLEHWDDADGSKGLSLFYFEPLGKWWKQVWVTDHARLPGGTKEKTLIHAKDGMAQFQGAVSVGAGQTVLDRTTLSTMPGGDVSQVIEISRDDGRTWTRQYDAVYRRATSASPQK